ncbi:MAG: DUF4339 domain-containing protein [Thermoguttaceae bacterium]|jgi:hypothetical protein
MDTDLYLRVRGRVLGPYGLEKLQTLVRRGQLSRMHEVSTDGTHWVQASSYAELFVGAPVKLIAPEVLNSSPPSSQQANASTDIPLAGESSEAAQARPRTPSSAGRRWYYEHAGMQNGPVEEAVLRQLLLTGQLDSEALVWNEGMSQWAAASQIPGLVSLVSRTARPSSGSSQASDADVQSLCNAACASHPWVMFLSITAFVYAVLCVATGFLILVHGANRGLPPLVALGLFWIASGVIHSVGGILLINYASRLSGLRYRSNCKDLENSMYRLKTFWMFVSIVLIVILAFIGFLTIWILTLGASLAGYV